MSTCVGIVELYATPKLLSGYLAFSASSVSNNFDPLKKIIKDLMCYFTLVLTTMTFLNNTSCNLMTCFDIIYHSKLFKFMQKFGDI